MSSAICDKPYSSSDKWTASFILGLLFLLISSPFLYMFTAAAMREVGLEIADRHGCPNILGLMLHASIFALIVRVLLNRDSGCIKPYTSGDKWTVAIIGGLLFMLLASPFLYGVINSLLSPIISTANVDGCPNWGGLILHSILFICIVRLLTR